MLDDFGVCCFEVGFGLRFVFEGTLEFVHLLGFGFRVLTWVLCSFAVLCFNVLMVVGFGFGG